MSPLVKDLYEAAAPNWKSWLNGLTVPAGGPPNDNRFPGDPGSGKMYFGASTDQASQSIAAFETQMGGTKAGIHRTYYVAANADPGDDVVDAMMVSATDDIANGRVPSVSWKVPKKHYSTGLGDPSSTFEEDWQWTVDGHNDTWLLGICARMATLDGPIWWTAHHEPYGDGNPVTWRAMYAHLASVMKPACPNLALTPILNGYEFFRPGGDPIAWFTPFADIQGVDNYNQWWTYETGAHVNYDGLATETWHPWRSPEQMFGPIIDQVSAWGVGGWPIYIPEFGCHYGWRNDGPAGNPTQTWAATYVNDSFDYCLSRGVVAMAWFNSGLNSPRGSWKLDKYTTPQTSPFNYGTVGAGKGQAPPLGYFTDLSRVTPFAANMVKAGAAHLV